MGHSNRRRSLKESRLYGASVWVESMGHIFRKRGESARCWKEGEPPPCEPPACRGRAATGCEAALPRVSSTSVAARAPPSATGEVELLPSLLLLDQIK